MTARRRRRLLLLSSLLLRKIWFDWERIEQIMPVLIRDLLSNTICCPVLFCLVLSFCLFLLFVFVSLSSSLFFFLSLTEKERKKKNKKISHRGDSKHDIINNLLFLCSYLLLFFLPRTAFEEHNRRGRQNPRFSWKLTQKKQQQQKKKFVRAPFVSIVWAPWETTMTQNFVYNNIFRIIEITALNFRGTEKDNRFFLIRKSDVDTYFLSFFFLFTLLYYTDPICIQKATHKHNKGERH